MNEVKIITYFITLGQLLKFLDFVQSGGEIKFFLLENKVLVNNEIENRKGRKIYKDYIVSINGETFKIC